MIRWPVILQREYAGSLADSDDAYIVITESSLDPEKDGIYRGETWFIRKV